MHVLQTILDDPTRQSLHKEVQSAHATMAAELARAKLELERYRRDHDLLQAASSQAGTLMSQLQKGKQSTEKMVEELRCFVSKSVLVVSIMRQRGMECMERMLVF
jgi:hypothetical protein